MYTHIIVLWIRDSKLLSNYMCDPMNNKVIWFGTNRCYWIKQVCSLYDWQYNCYFLPMAIRYTMFLWLSDASTKHQSIILQCTPPPVTDTYCIQIYKYTIKWLILVMSYPRSFSRCRILNMENGLFYLLKLWTEEQYNGCNFET